MRSILLGWSSCYCGCLWLLILSHVIVVVVHSQQVGDKAMCPETVVYGTLVQSTFLSAWSGGNPAFFTLNRVAPRTVQTDTAEPTPTNIPNGLRYTGLTDASEPSLTYHADCPTDDNLCYLYANLPPVVLVSGVTTTTATFGFRTDIETDTVRIVYSTNPIEDDDVGTDNVMTSTESTSTVASDDCTSSVSIQGLMEDTVYYYRLEVDGVLVYQDPLGLRTQRFRTYPTAGAKTFSFSVFADSANAISTTTVETYRMGGMTASTPNDDPTNPLFAMQIGDFDHSDPVSLRQYRTMHKELRSPRQPQGQRFVNHVASQTSFWHVWDDHDYCGNDSDGTCTRKAVARQAFDEHYRGYPYANPQEAIYYTFHAGNAQIFVLDTRSVRTPDLDPDGSTKTVLGSTQKQWLKDGLLASTHRWKIVVSSISANDSARPNNVDHWVSFQTEAQEMRSFLIDEGFNDGSVIMVSGDLHTGGAIDNGCHNRWGIPELGVANTNLRNGNQRNGGFWSEGVAPGSPGYATITVSPDSLLLEAKDGATGNVLFSLLIDNTFLTPCGIGARTLAPTTSQAPTTTATPSMAPTRRQTKFCFSHASTVDIEGKGATAMRDVQIGDRVLTANRVYESVYSFGHRAEEQTTKFLQLHVVPNDDDNDNHNRNKNNNTGLSFLELTDEHMLFVEGYQQPIPASWVKEGDRVHWISKNDDGEQLVTVKDIRQIVRKGSFAPFTPSGTIVVNELLASTFVGFQDSPVLKIGGYQTSIPYQTLAHLFETPHRLICANPVLFDKMCRFEAYSSGGVSQWVYLPLQFTLWLVQHLDEEKSVFAPALFCGLAIVAIPFIAVLLALRFVEMVCTGVYGLSVVLALLSVAGTWNCLKRLSKRTKVALEISPATNVQK